MNEFQAYQQFWESFKIPAYDESTTPEEATLPYITYNVITSDFGDTVYPTASIWYKGTSWTNVTEKAKEIESAIGLGGILVPFDNGYIWIKRDESFIRRMSDPDDLIRRIVLSLQVEYFKE